MTKRQQQFFEFATNNPELAEKIVEEYYKCLNADHAHDVSDQGYYYSNVLKISPTLSPWTTE